MAESAQTLAIAARLATLFVNAGAQPFVTDILQPAETLLDLYGEDIRARAYVTRDPVFGEMMLRPDFTVPVVQAHMAGAAEPARYTYNGPVFRKQEQAKGRAREYLQVGYEVFARDMPAQSDAEVFALIAQALAGYPVRAVTGDIGILRSAVAGLDTSDRCKAALLRHVWRPVRFRALVERMGGQGPLAIARAQLVDRLRSAPPAELIASAGTLVGLRGEGEIAERITALLAEADTPAIPPAQVHALESLLALEGPARAALAQMRDSQLMGLGPALDRLELRLDALEAKGIDTATLAFEASFGRSTMEYYDGFVFGFLPLAEGLPPIATGGRYDALTRVLGAGRAIPAVGGVIRPAVLAALEGGA